MPCMNLVLELPDLAVQLFEVVKQPLNEQSKCARQLANLPVCLIGMEACGSAHHWRRKLQSMCHTVRLMAPQFVKPYVKPNKNALAPSSMRLMRRPSAKRWVDRTCASSR